MKIERPKNTKKRGVVEFLFYPEKGRYIGVCLTFDIIEEGKDLNKLRASLEEAARLHLETVTKEGLSEDLLNRYAPLKYWNKYFEIQKEYVRNRAEKAVNNSLTQTLPYPRILATA
jgi:predicted RNase H-like HicB family nuclease